MIPNKMMYKGKVGLFSIIESTANLRNARAFVALSSLLLAISLLLRFAVPEIGVVPYFLVFSAVLFLASLVELVIIQKKKGVGTHLKWVVGISYIVAAITTTATMGPAGGIVFVFPMLLSIQYCSVLYSLFISAVTIMGTFVPLLLASRLSNYDLNVVRLVPGAAVQVTSTLEAALGSGAIDKVGTKVNELFSIFLPIILFVTIIAVVTVSICSAIRKNLLEQYHQFQTTRE